MLKLLIVSMLSVAPGLCIASSTDWKLADGFLGKYEVLEYKLESPSEKVVELPTTAGPSCTKIKRYPNEPYWKSEKSEAYSCKFIGTQIEIGSTFDPVNRKCTPFNIDSLKITNSFNIAACEFYDEKNSYSITDTEYSASKHEPSAFKGYGHYSTERTYSRYIVQNSDETFTVSSKFVSGIFDDVQAEKFVKLRRISQ